MSSYLERIKGDTKEAVEVKAREKIVELGIMRQPTIESISFVHPINGEPHWVATIKYWGLD